MILRVDDRVLGSSRAGKSARPQARCDARVVECLSTVS